LLSTSAYSALEVLHIMRYINLLTYLLFYLHIKVGNYVTKIVKIISDYTHDFATLYINRY